MSGSSNSEGVDTNLTPMLDLVFQLITFFMLVTNFKGAAMDLSLKLPVLGSARPLEWSGKNEPLMINLNSTGKIRSEGRDHEIDPFIQREARFVKLQLRAAGTDYKEGDDLPVPVILRADKDVKFATLNQVIRTCQEVGYRQFSLSAMNRAE
ncbi:MAG TPA: biopolymer transporter ExbD [Planctomycetaceae bacterium]|nr:biopolymer transporter ExbD [Planctomycetaceae bacterium]